MPTPDPLPPRLAPARAAEQAGRLRGNIERAIRGKGEVVRRAVETVIAAVSGDRNAIIAESADLLYHLLVTLKASNVTLVEVEDALGQRTGVSGLDEKASRKRL